MRNILLIEPNYKNKYPPIGLMKLSTYHKLLGDNVVFYKGEFKDFLINEITNLCISKLNKIDNSISWQTKYSVIKEFIERQKIETLDKLKLADTKFKNLILNSLIYYKDYYKKKEYLKNKYWDRICITTLFTFHWNITIKTINFYRQFIKNENELWVGGVMASVIPQEIKNATGLNNIYAGLLNKKGILDNNEIIIDDLPLDYSILKEIDYIYPVNNSYFAYATRGCIRKCKFCAVPIIEPKYVKQVILKDQIDFVNKYFGCKQNLMLLDNNVLASPNFSKIINEIKKIGFNNNSKFIEPNQLEIAYKNLKSNINNNGYIKEIVNLFNKLLEKLKGEKKQELYNILLEHNLLISDTSTKEEINNVMTYILPLYNSQIKKRPKQRHVDFNQGLDARLLTDEKAKLLSQIPIRPLRIAFDNMKYIKYYKNAIINSCKYGIKNFSNYLLYNFDEKPIELYQRLKINIELCEEFNINIYSFPMKYHPIYGEYKLNRDYIGKYWNRKFIRAVQVILNATKGKIGKGKSFFYKAFGNNEDEFFKLLYMPETYILYRLFFERIGLTSKWWNSFKSLSDVDLIEIKNIIEQNNFKDIDKYKNNSKIYEVLKHYTITREKIKNGNLSKLKMIYDQKLK